jgi:hypothetical protein
MTIIKINSCDIMPPVPPIIHTIIDNNSIYEDIKNILNHEDSIRLDNTALVEYFKKNKILDNQTLIQYMYTKNIIFNQIYTDHYIKHNKSFILMNNLESMCQCWLMHLYH